MLDTLITHATVYDGLDPEPRRVSVGIEGGRIVHVGETPLGDAARTTVDGTGLALCPGFIDSHASTGLGYLLPHAGDNKLTQGVTTEVIGNCGTSSGPVGDRLHGTMGELAEQIGCEYSWRSLGEWFERIEAYGLPFNIGTFVGHSTLRAGTCEDAQDVDTHEIDAMCALLEQGMADGALGLSTGLVYAPGSFAKTSEIIRLAAVAARHGGIYVSHVRDERQGLEASVEEARRIGAEGGCRVLVSHLKAAEKPNWGKIPGVIASIEAARAEGQEISFEVYPYTAVSTKLRTFIPKGIMEGGVEGLVDKLRTEAWRSRCVEHLVGRETHFEAMILITESLTGARGKSIAELARELDVAPAEAVVEVLIADPDAWVVYDCISQDDLDRAVLWPHSIICSDSWSYPVNSPNPIGNPHPRTFGAFTRFLERYSLAEERIPFGEAVRKITSMPADWLRLEGRGRIEVGAHADLVLLDLGEVREMATFKDPRQFSRGTRWVWVNGEAALEEGSLVDRPRHGQVLRHAR